MSATQRKTYECNLCKQNGVTTAIYFDNRIKASSGKMIPQEVSSNTNHNCPFRAGAPKPVLNATPTQPPTQTVTPAPSQTLSLVEVLARFDSVDKQLKAIEQAVSSLIVKNVL